MALKEIRNPKSKRNGFLVEVVKTKREMSQGAVKDYSLVRFGDGVTIWTLSGWVR